MSLSKVRKSLGSQITSKDQIGRSFFINADCRKYLATIRKESVDCIITSPPYGALKNYGPGNQIGFGQKIKTEYLPDLRAVLRELYRVAKEGAALWVVVDSWKANGDMFPLPFEVLRLAKEERWTLQDIIIWDKGRSLPWSHRGRFRAVCEHILLFGKGELKTFNLDAVRDSSHLSSYWVKYPERYNPEGKAPSDLWHFPIPTQGSWAKTEIRHLCPFPTDLVQRMIAVTSSVGDVVLDPFGGTGVVCAVAGEMQRYGVGIEINPTYVKQYRTKGFAAIKQEIRSALDLKSGKALRREIVKLRSLKYPKTLHTQLIRPDNQEVCGDNKILGFVAQDRKSRATEKFGRLDLCIIFERAPSAKLRSQILHLCSSPPLSKYGLVVNCRFFSKVEAARQFRSSRKLFKYLSGVFYQSCGKGEVSEIWSTPHRGKVPPIFSNIDLQVMLPSLGS